jgi:glycosyltransferase involved in cell wall biosynthesis
MQLSVVVITYNEAANIGRCLRSVAGIADEIVVVDSASTDETCAIAGSYGALIFQRPFDGYSGQKNFANSCATHDWVLSLDADEELSEPLRQAILSVKAKPAHDAYFLKRLTSFCGHFIRHGGWYPDKQCRLWNKTKGAWNGTIHETWRLQDSTAAYGTLPGDLLHYSFNNISDYLKMLDKYSTLSAQAAKEKGKRCSLLKLLFGPPLKFLQDYLLRGGFRDGYYGYLACKLAAYGAFVKYSKIREQYRS